MCSKDVEEQQKHNTFEYSKDYTHRFIRNYVALKTLVEFTEILTYDVNKSKQVIENDRNILNDSSHNEKKNSKR